jgi:hypothetical protein
MKSLFARKAARGHWPHEAQRRRMGGVHRWIPPPGASATLSHQPSEIASRSMAASRTSTGMGNPTSCFASKRERQASKGVTRSRRSRTLVGH